VVKYAARETGEVPEFPIMLLTPKYLSNPQPSTSMQFLCATNFSPAALAAADMLGSTVQAVLARSHKPVFVVTSPLS